MVAGGCLNSHWKWQGGSGKKKPNTNTNLNFENFLFRESAGAALL